MTPNHPLQDEQLRNRVATINGLAEIVLIFACIGVMAYLLAHLVGGLSLAIWPHGVLPRQH